MANTLSASPAQGINRERIIEQAFEVTRQNAIQQAAKQGKRVDEIADVQREEVQQLVGGAVGPNGAAIEWGASSGPVAIIDEIDQRIEEDDVERKKAIEATPDATVFKRTDEKVGEQDDSTRGVKIADEVLLDPTLATRVSKHEAAHRLEEPGDQVMQLPPTGVEAIDRHRGQVRRRVFREDHAIGAEDGLKNHTPEYVGYVETADAIEGELDRADLEGEQMVEEAALTVDGFQQVQEAMVMVAVQKKIEDQRRKMPEVMLA